MSQLDSTHMTGNTAAPGRGSEVADEEGWTTVTPKKRNRVRGNSNPEPNSAGKKQQIEKADVAKESETFGKEVKTQKSPENGEKVEEEPLFSLPHQRLSDSIHSPFFSINSFTPPRFGSLANIYSPHSPSPINSFQNGLLYDPLANYTYDWDRKDADRSINKEGQTESGSKQDATLTDQNKAKKKEK